MERKADWVGYKEDGHLCVRKDKDFPEGGYYNNGVAVNECAEDESGRFIVSNGEYANPVNYCPFCGVKAKVGLDETT